MRENHYLKPPTDEELILEVLMDETGTRKLPDKLERKFALMSFADDQLRALRTPKQVVQMLINRYSISRNLAYQIISSAQYVFGKNKEAVKEYYRQLIIDSLLEDLRKARERGDSKSAIGFYDKLIKSMGLDKDDSNKPPVTPAPAVLVFTGDTSALGSTQDPNIEKRVMDFLSKSSSDAQIITDPTDEPEEDLSE